ncbi:MAG: beta-propeller fold lactonase family protein [Xanthomonadales bacterium]|nr:beta-propeller fold lactonase family protein [Xanthomonadales bacterium]
MPLLEGSGQSITTPINLLDGVYGVAVSPDNTHVYATAFQDDFVVIFNRSPASGFLTYTAAISAPAINGPQLLTVAPDGEQVYVASGIAGSLTVLTRNQQSGLLSVFDIFDSNDVADLQGAYGVAVTPNGRFIYVSSVIQNAVIGFERLNDDSLVFRASNSDLSNADLIQTRNLAVSPDGLNLYVTAENAANADSGNLLIYDIDPSTGAISEVQMFFEGMVIGMPFGIVLDGLGGPFDVEVSPDGANVYVACTHDDTLLVFRRNPDTGLLTYRRRMKNGEDGVDGLDGATGVTVTPDGRYVIATAFDDDAVTVFGRDPDDGFLNQLQTISRGPLPFFNPRLDGARDLAVSPDGHNVYVGAFLDDAVVAFQGDRMFNDGFESGATATQ